MVISKCIRYPAPLGAAISERGFCAFRPAKASPFGRGVCAADGEGKPVSREPPCSDGQALCQSDTIAVSELFSSVLALSGAPRQLPQRGSHWRVGQASTGRAKHDVPETVVLRCLGQRQLDKERL